MNETLNFEEATVSAKCAYPVYLEVKVTRNTKEFIYEDYSKEVVRQYIINRTVRAYFSDIQQALKAIEMNKKVIESYTIYCSLLVVGDNYF